MISHPAPHVSFLSRISFSLRLAEEAKTSRYIMCESLLKKVRLCQRGKKISHNREGEKYIEEYKMRLEFRWLCFHFSLEILFDFVML